MRQTPQVHVDGAGGTRLRACDSLNVLPAKLPAHSVLCFAPELNGQAFRWVNTTPFVFQKNQRSKLVKSTFNDLQVWHTKKSGQCHSRITLNDLHTRKQCYSNNVTTALSKRVFLAPEARWLSIVPCASRIAHFALHCQLSGMVQRIIHMHRITCKFKWYTFVPINKCGTITFTYVLLKLIELKALY